MFFRSRCIATAFLLFSVASSATAALGQSESDRKTLEKARSAYLTGPVPGQISCGVALDWDGFFQRMKMAPDDAAKARLEKLKDIKISVVSRDEQHTEVKIDGDASNQIADGLRQQLQGFFQIFWSQSYGRMLNASPGEAFELSQVPEGYQIKMASGATKVSIAMDKAYVITQTNIESPQMNAVATPGYKAGDDGLLRLRTFGESIDMGTTKMVIEVGLDYQKVGQYEIPLHIHMGLPGSYSFDYTLTGCEVKDSTAAPAAKS